jgi:acyl carrier protein
VLDDAIMLNLDATRLLRVMAPKARGAWILHKHTQHVPLDFFVLFSSVSSLVGSPGQGNYVAANAYLDALAHHRRAMGLPATCINWGALSEVGMAATNKDVAAHLARGGMKPLEPQDAVRALGMALERNATQIAVFDLDWQKWRRAFRSMADLPKFAGVLDEGTESSADSPNPFRSALVEANLQDRVEIAVLAIADLIGEATRMPPEKIDPQASLMDLGIDSLMALEVQVAIESRFGVSCSVLDLQKGDGLRGLAQRLVSRMALPAEVMN